MRAVIVERFGPLEEAAVKEVEMPAPGPKQVLIEARNAGVNFPDLLMITGAYQVRPELPFCPGMEVSGVVAAVGEEVENVSTGQRVAALIGQGAYAQQVLAPEASCYPIPEDISFEHAAALGLVYQTAHFALTERTHLSAGERVLVTGAERTRSWCRPRGAARRRRPLPWAKGSGSQDYKRARRGRGHRYRRRWRFRRVVESAGLGRTNGGRGLRLR
jgi:D-arabinose 1-dehydrogenase-like Zn-dependent alcohol dehydrogenase